MLAFFDRLYYYFPIILDSSTFGPSFKHVSRIYIRSTLTVFFLLLSLNLFPRGFSMILFIKKHY